MSTKFKKTLKIYIVLILTISVLTLSLVSCSKLKSKKSYIVATAPDNPPMEMITKDNRITGFDIDLIKAISEKSNFGINIIPVIRENLIYGLIDGTYNIVISGISFSTELKTKYPDVSFSIPYLNIGDVIVISEDFYNFKGLSDLKGKTVGIKNDSTAEEVLKKYPKIKIVEYKDISNAFTDLARNKITAVVADLPIAAQFVYYNDEYKGIFKIADITLTKKEYVIGINKSNQDLLKKINSSITLLKKSGELNKMIKKWFLKG